LVGRFVPLLLDVDRLGLVSLLDGLLLDFALAFTSWAVSHSADVSTTEVVSF
jgi:hypothetical protein